MSKCFGTDKISHLSISIILTSILTFVVLVCVDIGRIIVTPLSTYGVNHWIPELITIFFFGIQLTHKVTWITRGLIIVCVFIYPLLTYSLVYGTVGTSLGLGTSSLFVAVMLMGVWTGSKRK